MKLKLIACGMLEAELGSLSSLASNTETTYIERELHSKGKDAMQSELQKQINNVDANKFDAICLAYGLCSNGIIGLSSPKLPLVIPRAHDCITLLLGSRARYSKEVESVPGTYWSSVGWSESGSSVQMGEDVFGAIAELKQKYGEANAKFLAEQANSWKQNYERLCFIKFGLPEENPAIEKQKAKAQKEGWDFEQIKGDASLLKKLITRNWSDDFLVLNPGETVASSYDENILKEIKCQSE